MATVLVTFQTLLAGVFVVSAVAKVRDGGPAARFTATVFRLAGVPGRLARPALVATVAGEFAVVLLLTVPLVRLSADPRWVTAGFVLAVGLLVAFSAALALAARARLRTPCGCFGDSSTAPGVRHLVRNAILAAAAATGALAAGPPAALSGESVAAGAVGLVLAAALVALDDLVAAFARPRPAVLTNRSGRLS
jgi:hypothetical protein